MSQAQHYVLVVRSSHTCRKNKRSKLKHHSKKVLHTSLRTKQSTSATHSKPALPGHRQDRKLRRGRKDLIESTVPVLYFQSLTQQEIRLRKLRGNLNGQIRAPQQYAKAKDQSKRSLQKVSTLATPKRKESTVSLRKGGISRCIAEPSVPKAESEEIAKSGITSQPRRTSRTIRNTNAQRQKQKYFGNCLRNENVGDTGRAAAVQNNSESQSFQERSHAGGDSMQEKTKTERRNTELKPTQKKTGSSGAACLPAPPGHGATGTSNQSPSAVFFIHCSTVICVFQRISSRIFPLDGRFKHPQGTQTHTVSTTTISQHTPTLSSFFVSRSM